jgi:tRNA(fMet)-specific endonuclease VapC
MYLLDTNIISYFFRGNISVVKKIDDYQENLGSSSIIVAELFFGTKQIPDLVKKKQIENFYTSFINEINIYSFDTKSALIFAELKFVKIKLGQIITDFDLMIASIAIAHDLILVTNNTKHFQNIENLKLENWFKTE